MIFAWVIGAGGLLGTALTRSLRADGTRLFELDARLPWSDSAALARGLANAVHEFARAAQGAERWEIYWAAGTGTMSSSESDFVTETAGLSSCLDAISSAQLLRSTPGAFAFASSAGAIYAGCQDPVISEDTAPAATSAYARAKLHHEAIVQSFLVEQSNRKVLIARLSTLYGGGQSTAKKQGLLTYMARCILRQQPIRIYVPMDTIRDYIWAADAASDLICAVRDVPAGVARTQIIASEKPVTIAEITGLFKRITRRTPRVVTSADRLSGSYPRRVQFRSIVKPACKRADRTSLTVGIAQLLAHERVRYVNPAWMRNEPA